MKLIKGQSYNGWTYAGLCGDGCSFSCDVCHKEHFSNKKQEYALQHFFYKDANLDDNIHIGTTCIKKDNYWTQKLGLREVK